MRRRHISNVKVYFYMRNCLITSLLYIPYEVIAFASKMCYVMLEIFLRLSDENGN